MLEFMRRGAKSWLAKVLIVLLIASFAVWGIEDAFTTRLDSAVATVGDESVTVDTYADALSRQRASLSQQAGQAISFEDMRALGFDARVLDDLIQDAAFRAEMDRLGIRVPDRAVAEAIQGDPGFQASGGFSPDLYRRTLDRLNLTPGQFEERTRTLIGRRLLTLAAIGQPEPVPGLAARIAAFETEQRTVALVTLSPERAEDPGEPGGEALLSYYEDNRERYRRPERRTGRYMHVSIADLAAENRPDEQAVRAAYENAREALSTPATRTIDQLPLTPGEAQTQAERVRRGEQSFEDLARALGESPADLDLGTVTRGELPGAVAEAVFAATEPGIVGPVRAPVGPVLIRVRALEEGGTPPFEEVRARLADRLATEAALERAPQLADRIEDLRATGAAFEEIARTIGLEVRRFEELTRAGTVAGEDGRRPASGLVGRSAFVEEVFASREREEREILETEAGGYFVVLLDEIRPSAVPGLTEIQDRVVEDWRRDRRLDAVSETAEGYVRRLSGEATLADLAADLGLEMREIGPFTRANAPPVLPPALVAALFEAPEGDAAQAIAPSREGVVLAEVTAVEIPDPETLGMIAGRIEGQIGQQMTDDLARLYARAVTARFPTEIDQGVVEDVFGMLGAGRRGG